MNHHQVLRLILVMLNQQGIYKSAKYTNLGKICITKKGARLTSDPAFVVLNYVIWLIRNCVEFMFCLFIEKDFESKGGRKRKTKRKIESIKIMIYEEYIN